MWDFLFAFVIGVAQAQGTPAKPACNLDSKSSQLTDTLRHRLKGTIELTGRPGDCSAAFVTLEGRRDSERGLLLTSGHCIGFGKSTYFGGLTVPAAGEVFYRLKESLSVILDTGNSGSPRVCLSTDEIIYATVTDSDIAIFQLTESYDEIEARTSVKPFMISKNTNLSAGIKVHAPSALYRENLVCAIDAVIPKLVEFEWTWGPVLRLTAECRLRGGSSGSPLLREDTNEVIGVMGTNYSAAKGVPCLYDPCEVDEKGRLTFAKKGQSYAHVVYRLYSCLDARGNIDLQVPGCLLPKPQK